MGQGVDDEVLGYGETEILTNHPGGEAQEAVEQSNSTFPPTFYVLPDPTMHFLYVGTTPNHPQVSPKLCSLEPTVPSVLQSLST